MHREDGQTMPEYGVVLTVITLAIVTVLTAFSTAVQASVERVLSLLP